MGDSGDVDLWVDAGGWCYRFKTLQVSLFFITFELIKWIDW